MDEEIKDLLEKNLALAEENNRLLRNIRTATRLGIVWKVIYLAFFIVSALFAFSFLKPYLNEIHDAYGKVTSVQTQLKGAFHL
jgi:predicted MFS family arabinose efflux permease